MHRSGLEKVAEGTLTIHQVGAQEKHYGYAEQEGLCG